ncbi:MAG TPA: hypothetical protein PLN91_00965 [Rhodanobacteraceae bacterium]|nr:hypothetical protein [Rhodanobacteraceae bacterium]
MTQEQSRLSMAEAVRLHDAQLALANEEVCRLRRELEAAIQRQGRAREARLQFLRFVMPAAG